MIAENLHRIEQEIQESCALASRNPEEITMVAVTKSVDSMTANELVELGALDSLRLAQEIQKRAEHQIKCFIEVNVSGEESKHGIRPSDLQSFIKELEGLEKIQVIGLMTMAPYEATELEIRNVFSTLKQLQESVKEQDLQYAPCTELSMGMSQDFKTAIEEGATFVRIGTALFKKG